MVRARQTCDGDGPPGTTGPGWTGDVTTIVMLSGRHRPRRVVTHWPALEQGRGTVRGGVDPPRQSSRRSRGAGIGTATCPAGHRSVVSTRVGASRAGGGAMAGVRARDGRHRNCYRAIGGPRRSPSGPYRRWAGRPMPGIEEEDGLRSRRLVASRRRAPRRRPPDRCRRGSGKEPLTAVPVASGGVRQGYRRVVGADRGIDAAGTTSFFI